MSGSEPNYLNNVRLVKAVDFSGSEVEYPRRKLLNKIFSPWKFRRNVPRPPPLS